MQGSGIENMSADEVKKMRKALVDSSKATISATKRRPYGSTYAEEVLLGDETGLVLTTVEDATPIISEHTSENESENFNTAEGSSYFRPRLVSFEPSPTSSILPPNAGIPMHLQALSSSGAPSGSELLKKDLEDCGFDKNKLFDDGALRVGSSSWSRASKGSARYSDERASQSSLGSFDDDRRSVLHPTEVQGAHQESSWQLGSVQRPTPTTNVTKSTLTHEASASSRTIELTADGRRIIRYRNGTVKETKADGSVEVKFANGIPFFSARVT